MSQHKAIIYYFKQSGKYYTEGELELLPEEIDEEKKLALMFKICERLRLLGKQGKLPGLSFGSNWLAEGYAYINVSDIGYPCLLIPRFDA